MVSLRSGSLERCEMSLLYGKQRQRTLPRLRGSAAKTPVRCGVKVLPENFSMLFHSLFCSHFPFPFSLLSSLFSCDWNVTRIEFSLWSQQRIQILIEKEREERERKTTLASFTSSCRRRRRKQPSHLSPPLSLSPAPRSPDRFLPFCPHGKGQEDAQVRRGQEAAHPQGPEAVS